QPAQPREQRAAVVAGDVVDRAAREDEVEWAPDRQIRQGRAHPRHVHPAALGELLRLAQPFVREIEADRLMSVLGQEHAIAPLAAPESPRWPLEGREAPALALRAGARPSRAHPCPSTR